MANIRSTDNDARLIEQLARGRRTRYVVSKSIIIGNARTNNTAPNRIMADAIAGETYIFGLFVAPCDGKVVRITANGTPFIDNDTAETSTVKLTKAVIGAADIDLCTNITVGDVTVPTLDTAIDAVLSTTATDLNLLNGQHVYGTLVVGATVQTAVSYVTVEMEWCPTDLGYPQS